MSTPAGRTQNYIKPTSTKPRDGPRKLQAAEKCNHGPSLRLVFAAHRGEYSSGQLAMELRWIASTRGSWAHAAAALAGDAALTSDELTKRLWDSVQAIKAWLAANRVRPVFWEHLPPLAAGIVRNDELAKVILTKSAGRERADAIAASLTGLLRDLEVQWNAAFPELAEQLALRAAPLREQWDARGNGLMRSLGNLTEPELVADQAEVILVEPVLGGGGQAHLPYNSVRIEAVLANAHAELPEPVRLGWLLAQLQLDLPRFRELLAAATPQPQAQTPDTAASGAVRIQDDIAGVSALAVLPPLLAAAQEVEWARLDEETLRLAVSTWCGSPPDGAAIAATLFTWWETYRDARPRFEVALRALWDMLHA